MTSEKSTDRDEKFEPDFDAVDRAILAVLAPDPLADPGENYFRSLSDSVMRQVNDAPTAEISSNRRREWWRAFVDAFRLRPFSLGIPAAVAAALVAVLIVRPSNRLPGLDLNDLKESAVIDEAKKLDPARTVLIPSLEDADVATTALTANDEIDLELTVDFDDWDNSAVGSAPPFIPVAGVTAVTADLGADEWLELQSRVNEAMESLTI